MTDIDDYDTQVNNELYNFEKDIKSIETKNFDQKQVLLKKLTQQQKQIGTLIETYELEIQSLDRLQSKQYQKQLQVQSQKFKQLKNDLSNKKNEYQLGSFQDKSELDISQMSSEQLIQVGKSTQLDSINRLDGILGTVHQGNQLADQINIELDKQIEQLDRMYATVKDTQTNLERTKALIKYFARAIQTDKCIMGMIFLLVLGLITMIIVNEVKDKNQNKQ